MSETILKVTDLTKHFGGLTAVSNVSMELEKGELIGLAFDGNIEAMAGDVIFDKNLQRTINCDIRYVLWVVDKFAGAKHIVDEMTIVK